MLSVRLHWAAPLLYLQCWKAITSNKFKLQSRTCCNSDACTLCFQYNRLASDYNNCSCINATTNQETVVSQDKAHPPMPYVVNPLDIHPSSTQSPTQDSQSKTEQWCHSFLVEEKKLRRTYLCKSCIRSLTFQDKYFSNLFSHFPRNIVIIEKNVCWSFKGSCYAPICRATICCHNNKNKHNYKLLKNKIKFSSDKELQHKIDTFIDSFYEKVLKVLEPLHQDKMDNKLGSEATRKVVNSVTPAVMSTANTRQTTVQLNGTTVMSGFNSSDGCNRTGHITQFYGASCRSNRSVNFFYMDSERFWGVAQRLGAHDGNKNKTCLLVIDTKVMSNLLLLIVCEWEKVLYKL